MGTKVINWFSDKRLYAILQIGGWGLYGMLLGFLYYSSSNYNLGNREIFSIFYTCLFGGLITHGFRFIIKKFELASLPIVQLIPSILGANLLMSMLFMSLILIVDNLIKLEGPVKLTFAVILASFINGTILFLLWSLLYFILIYVKESRKREMDKIKWEGAMKEFELNKLKSQLNPHFVFNALNSIRSLIEEDPQKAKQSITQLSNILRSSLISDRTKIIPLSEELKTINDYLNLEKLRYEERLNPIIEIDAEALIIPVPPMMLQTIVENAVKHGIMNQTHTGFIAIKARVDNTRQLLHVSIENSGRLGSLESGGFGILNTRQRMKILYGEEAQFAISQQDENTVIVSLILPTSPLYL
jgi:LytS/YehU family sensor histidine kinase